MAHTNAVLCGDVHRNQASHIKPDYDDAKGVPIDAIIFGGRTRDREPLIRAILDPAEGIYDGK